MNNQFTAAPGRHHVNTISGSVRVVVPVSNPLGGIRNYMLYNLSRLVGNGYEFTFVAPQGDAFDAFKKDVSDWPGVGFIDSPVRSRKTSLWRAVHSALKREECALIHSQGLRAGAEAALGNLTFGVPHILTLHDVILPQNDIPGRLKWLKRLVTDRLTRRIDEIIPVSEDCSENHLHAFPGWKRAKCRITVIHNGVDVERICEAADASRNVGSVRELLGLGPNVFMGGFFGRFMPQKGFLVLLEALKLLARKDVGNNFCLIATKDPHGYRSEYITEVEKSADLRRLVRFVDPVSEIAPLLVQMDALIMPSLWEACPLLPMEAMVLGVPVVGSDAIGLRGVLKDTPSLMPRAGDANALAESIAEAMRTLLKDEALEYRATAMERFDNKLANSSLAAAYERHVRCPRNPQPR